jgi:hypothetical protein
MVKTAIAETLSEVYEFVPHFIKLPENRMSIDYNKEADVLYMGFKRPQKATDSEIWELYAQMQTPKKISPLK